MSQEELPFIEGEAGRGTTARRELRIVAAGPVKLSAAQKKFNGLVKRIEALRLSIAREEQRLDASLADYIGRIHPWRAKERAERRVLLRALEGWWRSPKGLGVRQRANLREVMLAQFDDLMAEVPGEEDADLVALVTELQAEAEREEHERRKAAGIDGFDTDDDDDVDFEDVFSDIENEFFGATAGGAESRGEAAGSGAAPRGARRESKAEVRRREESAAREEARKRGISTIYKQLAKVLHPDLERDPERRAEKQALMQQVVAAHRAGDLHTLLRLELEYIHHEEAQLAKLSDDKLKIYSGLLEEQVRELESQRDAVAGQPRFDAIRGYLDPFNHSLPDWVEVEELRRQVVASIQATCAGLAGSPAEAKAKVRGLLAAFEEERKRQRQRRMPWAFF